MFDQLIVIAKQQLRRPKRSSFQNLFRFIDIPIRSIIVPG